MTTLEEVFIKIASQKEEKAFFKQLSKSKSLQRGNSELIRYESTRNFDTKSLKELKYSSQFNQNLMQIMALSKKRFLYFKRDWISIFC